MGTVPLHSPTMKLLLLLAALTTTTLAKPFLSEQLPDLCTFGIGCETTAAPTTTPDPNADNEALCTLLFYPLEGWFSICPQSARDNDKGDEGLFGLGVKIPFTDITLRADGSAVPKPELKGWKKLEDAEELEELKLKVNELARMQCRVECEGNMCRQECRQWTVERPVSSANRGIKLPLPVSQSILAQST